MAEAPRLDPALGAFVDSRSEADADDRLGALLEEVARPVVARVVRAQLAGVPESDREDVAAGALLRLTERLRALRAGEATETIESLRAYAIVTAQNGCRAFLRARQPERTRLGNQVRYLLGHDPALARWPGADGAWLAGLAGWRGRAAERPRPDLDGLPLERAAAELELGELIRRLLLLRGGPWPVLDLVAALAELRGVRDQPLVSLTEPAADEDEAAPGQEPVETRPGPLREAEDRQFLSRIWAEVRDLPRRQRVALLLNLRDAGGGDMLSLLPVTGLASAGEVARVLDLPAAELAELWPRLPLEDREIAALLQATPRQVINLRKSARERLARRTRHP